MRKLILLIAVSFTTLAYGATDFVCVRKCQDQGNSRAMCESKCEYGETPRDINSRMDYSCQARCTSTGMNYNLCQEKCAY